jgi:hypothetical protein
MFQEDDLPFCHCEEGHSYPEGAICTTPSLPYTIDCFIALAELEHFAMTILHLVKERGIEGRRCKPAFGLPLLVTHRCYNF